MGSLAETFNLITPKLPAESRQVFLVTEDPAGISLAKVTAWDQTDGAWQQVFPPIPSTIGRNGFVPVGNKVEGDGCTPLGVYRLGLVFGSEASAPTAMPYRQAQADDVWVDDPSSPEYNRWVRGTPEASSYENLLRPDGMYKYGIVIEYNTGPVVAGKGSAIFVHLWREPGEPTAGCVAMDEASLLRILAWLDPAKRPVIVLGS